VWGVWCWVFERWGGWVDGGGLCDGEKNYKRGGGGYCYKKYKNEDRVCKVTKNIKTVFGCATHCVRGSGVPSRLNGGMGSSDRVYNENA